MWAGELGWGIVFALALDTSSPAVTAAIVTLDGTAVTTLAVRAPVAPRGHDELLAPAIRDCLAETGLRADGLHAVVAGVGPGPYTGLRVGLVTAAAFAHATGIPAYGVCSLDGIGAARPDDAALLVVTDARRREVYWARYARGERVAGPAVDRPTEVPREGVDAVAGAAGALYEWPGLRTGGPPYPDPAVLVRAAADRIVAGAAGERLTPIYLRRPDAVVPGAPKAVTQ
jgi:tRNA threonylcarbamoyl adenosine modification protein YeaZ